MIDFFLLLIINVILLSIIEILNFKLEIFVYI